MRINQTAAAVKAANYPRELNERAVRELIDRVTVKGFSEHFLFAAIPEKNAGYDRFILESKQGKIQISASNTSAASAGFYHYIKTYMGCNVSVITRHVPIGRDTAPVPIKGRLERESPFVYRYFLNYCTYSYTMAFWDWEQFESLIDYMALNGINLALSIVGQEAVVRELLLQYGCTPEEADDYICGPAYFAWQWMNNLTGFCGPLPDWWYERSLQLGRRINARFRELGIQPLMPAFGGSVPKTFAAHHPEARLVPQGLWCAAYERPMLLLPEDPLFGAMADQYYALQRELLQTDCAYFSNDPFHEGGSEEGIDKAAYTRLVYAAMQRANPRAVWVFQGWILNPRRDMLAQLDQSQVLITDLVGDITVCYEESDDFLHYPWTLCAVNNYGGQRNYRGNFHDSLHNPYRALESQKAQGMCGIGLLMEGIEDVELFYDLLGELSFSPEKPDSRAFLTDYAARRYGLLHEDLVKAVSIVADEVLVCNHKDGTRESVFIARPSLHTTKVSSWTAEYCVYDNTRMAEAVRLMFRHYDALKENPSYLFDLVDMARQALSNCGWEVYAAMMAAHAAGDRAAFDREAERFLEMILLQDQLMSSQKRTHLSHWLDEARTLGRTQAEKNYFEENARTLITVWSDRPNECQLHDYASREWGGILREYHYKRWSHFIELLRSGDYTDEYDWYAFELPYTKPQPYSSQLNPDPGQTIGRVLSLVGQYCARNPLK